MSGNQNSRELRIDTPYSTVVAPGVWCEEDVSAGVLYNGTNENRRLMISERLAASDGPPLEVVREIVEAYIKSAHEASGGAMKATAHEPLIEHGIAVGGLLGVEPSAGRVVFVRVLSDGHKSLCVYYEVNNILSQPALWDLANEFEEIAGKALLKP